MPVGKVFTDYENRMELTLHISGDHCYVQICNLPLEFKIHKQFIGLDSDDIGELINELQHIKTQMDA